MTDQNDTYRVVWLGYIGSDWLAIYKDGRKVYEGHPPDFADALDLLGLRFRETEASSKVLADQRRNRGFPEFWEAE